MLNQDGRDILKVGISVANALSDGVDWSDVGVLLELPSAIDGWNNGVSNLKKCLVDDDGRLEILEYVENIFDIPNDQLEDKIEKSIAWLDATYGLFLTWSE